MTTKLIREAPKPAHKCEVPEVTYVASKERLGEIIQCEDCSRYWIFVFIYDGYAWRMMSKFEVWRKRIN